MKKLFFSILFCSTLFACKNDSEGYSPALVKAEKMVKEDPSRENLSALVKAIVVEYENTDDKAEKIALLKKGLDVASQHNMTKDVNSFRLGLITEDPTSEETGELLMTMAKEVKGRNNKDVADIMFLGIANEYESLSAAAKSELSNPNSNPDTLIAKAGNLIFPEDNPGQINKGVARAYVDMCEAYALANPSSEKSVDYLFKGAEMARSLKSLSKALSLYDMILLKYPESKKAASALFVKAFIMENDYQKIEEAKSLYLQFLEQYPEDELADDVEILLNNLGKSDEELYNAVKNK